MNKSIITIVVLIIIGMGFYFGYHQAISFKKDHALSNTAQLPTVSFDEQTAKSAAILAKQGTPKPLLPSNETTKIMEEIANGMKANLDLVKDAHGKYVRITSRPRDPELTLTLCSIEWTLKGNKIREYRNQDIHWVNKPVMKVFQQNYTNGSTVVSFSHTEGVPATEMISVDSVPLPSGTLLFDPFRYGVKLDGQTFKEFQKYTAIERNGEINVLGNSFFNGDSCYVIERVMRDPKESGRINENRQKIWFDPQKGFGMVNIKTIDILNGSTTYSHWSTHYEYAAYPLPDTSAVFWYPKAYQMFFYDSTGKNIISTQEYYLNINGLNQNLSDKDVDILWSPGIPISDHRVAKSNNYTIAHSAYSEDILSGKEAHIPYQSQNSGSGVTVRIINGRLIVTPFNKSSSNDRIKDRIASRFSLTPINISIWGGIIIIVGFLAYIANRKKRK